MPEMNDQKSIRKVFSCVGWALCVMLVAALGTQTVWFVLPNLIPGLSWLGEKDYWLWLGVGIPMYVIAIPLCALVLCILKATPPEKKPFGVGKFLLFVPVAFFITYAGNLIGTFLSLFLSGGSAENPLTDLVMQTSFWKILVIAIMAPVMEELVFRKLLIDRTVRFGEKTAVLLSAVTFGLFHQNLFQFFYAFGVGLLLGYLYVRSGKLRYPVILHMIINFIGSVVAPAIVSLVDQEALLELQQLPAEEMMESFMQMLPQLVGMLLYLIVYFGLCVAGLVLFIIFVKKLTWKEMPQQLEAKERFKTVYVNFGMITFVVLCAAMCVVSLL